MQTVDAEVPMEDRCAYQLLLTLLAEGWQHREKVPKDDAVLVPYVVNGPKIWWLFRTTKRLSALYFMALLLAGKHKRSVPHGRPEWYYKAIVENKDPDRVALQRRASGT